MSCAPRQRPSTGTLACLHSRIRERIDARAGYVPLGATIYHERVAGVLEERAGGPMTGHTFTGHTLACAAGVAVQRIVVRDRLVARVAQDGPRLMARLKERLSDIDALGDVRGRGFFIGLEVVADRTSKTPFSPALA